MRPAIATLSATYGGGQILLKRLSAISHSRDGDYVHFHHFTALASSLAFAPPLYFLLLCVSQRSLKIGRGLGSTRLSINRIIHITCRFALHLGTSLHNVRSFPCPAKCLILRPDPLRRQESFRVVQPSISHRAAKRSLNGQQHLESLYRFRGRILGCSSISGERNDLQPITITPASRPSAAATQTCIMNLSPTPIPDLRVVSRNVGKERRKKLS